MYDVNEPTNLSAAVHYGALAAQAQAGSNIHPALAASIDMALGAAKVLRMQEYVSRLRAHDWQCEWSDDHNVRMRGSAERRALRQIADAIDRDFSVWNAHCHPEHRDGGRL